MAIRPFQIRPLGQFIAASWSWQTATFAIEASNAPAPPVFTVAPSISGAPEVGATITLSRGTVTGGTITGAELLRGATVIDSEPAATYVLTPADAGETLTLRVTAAQGGTVVEATSAAFGPVVEEIIAALFAASEQGAWYDPSDLSTLWADTAGTIPAEIGGRVARMDDKSGNGNHALQATEASRPFLRKADTRYFLDFATSRWMTVAAFNMSATDEITVIAGVRKTADTAARIVCELTTNAAGTTGGFNVAAPQNTGASGNFGFFTRGTSGSTPVVSSTALAPVNAVITGLSKISTPSMIIRRNGVQEGILTTTQGTGNFANAGFFIGSRNGSSLYYGGELYGLIVRGALTTGTDLTNAESYMTGKTGDGSLRLTQAYALGDSTVATFLGGTALMTLMNTDRTRVSLAVPGDTIANQKDDWVAATITPATVGWVIIQVGLNDLEPAEAASVAIARLQDLVDTVKTEVGSKPVLISKMSPCRGRLIVAFGGTNGPIAYQKWLDMNEAIAGGGATPITNVDGRITAHEPLLNDGSGNLRTEFQTPEQDGIHPNTAGRLIVADAWEDVLRSLSVPV